MIAWIKAWWARWFAAPDPCDIDMDYLGTHPIPKDMRVPGEATWAKMKDKP